MKSLRTFLARCAGFWRRTEAEASLREEIEAHLEMEAEQLIAQGMDPVRAREEARRRFGHVEGFKEQCREQGRLVWLEQWGRDVVAGSRVVVKAPVYSGVIVLTLALAFGSAAAILMISRQVFFPVICFPEPESLLEVHARNVEMGTYAGFGAAEMVDVITKGCRSMMPPAVVYPTKDNLMAESEPVLVQVGAVNAEFSLVWSCPIGLGRWFTREEAKSGDASVVILSHSTWVRQFAADPQILGRGVRVGSQIRKVVGVLPKQFLAPPCFEQWDVLIPLADAFFAIPYNYKQLRVFTRPEKGFDSRQVQAELRALRVSNERLRHTLDRFELRVRPVLGLYYSETSYLLWLLIGAAGLVYAIACANVLNFIVVRQLGRGRELAIRLALGGTSGRVGRLLAVENLVLVCLAGCLGYAIALMASASFAQMTSFWWNGPIEIQPSWCVVFVAGLGVLASLLVLLPPVLGSWRKDLNGALKQGGAALGVGRKLARMQGAFVLLQAALAVVLVAGTSMLLRSAWALEQDGFAFDPRGKLALSGPIPALPYDAYLVQIEAMQRVLGELPGVEHVEIAQGVPLVAWSWSTGTHFGPAARETGGAGDAEWCGLHDVSPGYFRMMGMHLVRGEGFDACRVGGPMAVVINAELARRLFAQENPIGQLLDLGAESDWSLDPKVTGRHLAQILGVLENDHTAGHTETPAPEVFYPYWQRPHWATREVGFVLKTRSGGTLGLEKAVREALYKINPALPVSIWSLEKEAFGSNAPVHYGLRTLQVFSVLALLLSILGMYSIMAYSVRQRRREFGLRVALGADTSSLVRMILVRGMKLAGLGVLIGVLLAWFLCPQLAGLLFRVSPRDPLSLSVAAGFLLASSCLACWWPAVAVAELDPMESLRAE